MKIYRYEHEDGGGPFVKPDGWLRFGPKMKIVSLVPGAKYGCPSLKQLLLYFKD